jgi:hypothetical protein
LAGIIFFGMAARWPNENANDQNRWKSPIPTGYL